MGLTDMEQLAQDRIAWTATAWHASFRAVGGTLSFHDGALVVGWLLTDAEQDRAAAEVSREIAGNPERIAAVRKLIANVDKNHVDDARFDAPAWLRRLTEIGGGYALGAGRLWLIVHDCDAVALEGVMRPLMGHPERVDAVRSIVLSRQIHEAEAPS